MKISDLMHLGAFEFGTVAGSHGHDEQVYVRSLVTGRSYRIKAAEMPNSPGWPCLTVDPVEVVDGYYAEPRGKVDG